MDERALNAVYSADQLEGLARLIRLSVSRIAEQSNNPDADAIARLAADMVRLARQHRDALIAIASEGAIDSLQITEAEPEAIQVH